MNLGKANFPKGTDQRELTTFTLFWLLPAAESMCMSHLPSLSIWSVQRDTAVHPPWFAPSSKADSARLVEKVLSSFRWTVR